MTATPRQLLSFHARRSPGRGALLDGIAQALAVDRREVAWLDDDVDPAVRVEANDHDRGFQVSLELYVDASRRPLPSIDALAAALARALHVDIAYDDDETSDPYSWRLVRPDGKRYKASEQPGDHDGLVLDEDRLQEIG